jgi:hypothetical protein
MDQRVSEDSIPNFSHSARHSVSSYVRDSAATPKSAQAEDPKTTSAGEMAGRTPVQIPLGYDQLASMYRYNREQLQVGSAIGASQATMTSTTVGALADASDIGLGEASEEEEDTSFNFDIGRKETASYDSSIKDRTPTVSLSNKALADSQLHTHLASPIVRVENHRRGKSSTGSCGSSPVSKRFGNLLPPSPVDDMSQDDDGGKSRPALGRVNHPTDSSNVDFDKSLSAAQPQMPRRIISGKAKRKFKLLDEDEPLLFAMSDDRTRRNHQLAHLENTRQEPIPPLRGHNHPHSPGEKVSSVRHDRGHLPEPATRVSPIPTQPPGYRLMASSPYLPHVWGTPQFQPVSQVKRSTNASVNSAQTLGPPETMPYPTPRHVTYSSYPPTMDPRCGTSAKSGPPHSLSESGPRQHHASVRGTPQNRVTTQDRWTAVYSRPSRVQSTQSPANVPLVDNIQWNAIGVSLPTSDPNSKALDILTD